MLNGCVVYTRLSGQETHLEIAGFLKNVFSKFLDGEIEDDLLDVSDKEMTEETEKELDDYKTAYIAREGSHGDFSLAGLNFYFDEGRDTFPLPPGLPEELNETILLTAKELSAGNLAEVPMGDEAEEMENLASAFLSRPEEDDEELESFIMMAGSYWGEVLVRRFNGKWIKHITYGLCISNIAETGLVLDPFELVQARLNWGAPLAFPKQIEIFESWIERLESWRKMSV
jgi:hypothetical protein